MGVDLRERIVCLKKDSIGDVLTTPGRAGSVLIRVTHGSTDDAAIGLVWTVEIPRDIHESFIVHCALEVLTTEEIVSTGVQRGR